MVVDVLVEVGDGVMVVVVLVVVVVFDVDVVDLGGIVVFGLVVDWKFGVVIQICFVYC